jgi:hypothetical protein
MVLPVLLWFWMVEEVAWISFSGWLWDGPVIWRWLIESFSIWVSPLNRLVESLMRSVVEFFLRDNEGLGPGIVGSSLIGSFIGWSIEGLIRWYWNSRGRVLEACKRLPLPRIKNPVLNSHLLGSELQSCQTLLHLPLTSCGLGCSSYCRILSERASYRWVDHLCSLGISFGFGKKNGCNFLYL